VRAIDSTGEIHVPHISAAERAIAGVLPGKKLPQSEHDSPEWRLAIQMLIDAAEDRGPMLFAKMGMLRATNQNVERVFNPSRKESHWGRRKLKRDT
jgi:hypothetical protein